MELTGIQPQLRRPLKVDSGLRGASQRCNRDKSYDDDDEIMA